MIWSKVGTVAELPPLATGLGVIATVFVGVIEVIVCVTVNGVGEPDCGVLVLGVMVVQLATTRQKDKKTAIFFIYSILSKMKDSFGDNQ